MGFNRLIGFYEVEKEMSESKDGDYEFADETEQEDSQISEIPKEARILRTQAYDKSVSDIVKMIGDEDIRLDPDYQRNYIWDNKRASLLVESILLNVPIPVIYVEEDAQNQWNVVDGLQRLNTMRRFFANEFKLTGLDVLSELNREQYSTLNPKAQRILRNGILRIIVILQESHPEIKYDIFQRLNRGAVRLNEQELRNCLYRGKFNDAIKESRSNELLQKLMGLTKPHPRFVDAELVLRATALISKFETATNTLPAYPGKMKGFLNAFMIEKRNAPDDEIAALTLTFAQSLDKAVSVFGEKVFRRIDPATNVADGPINRALMDVVMVSFSHHQKTALKTKAQAIQALLASLIKDDEKFREAITYGTNDKARLEYRLSRWCSGLTKLLA